MCATGLDFTQKHAGLLYATKPRAAPLTAKAELKLSDFFAMADGGRREGPMEKSLPRCFCFSVKRKRKQMHMEGGGGGGPHLLCGRKQWGL